MPEKTYLLLRYNCSSRRNLAPSTPMTSAAFGLLPILASPGYSISYCFKLHLNFEEKHTNIAS